MYDRRLDYLGSSANDDDDDDDDDGDFDSARQRLNELLLEIPLLLFLLWSVQW